jgi:hypothetical protein
MLYLERNTDGSIKAIHQAPHKNAQERKSLMDEEVLKFLGTDNMLNSWIKLLSISDHGIIRVLEDLIDVLVRKNVIMLTDLPEEARDKLKERKKVREHLEHDQIMVDDIL